jgi:hypothetical protein
MKGVQPSHMDMKSRGRDFCEFEEEFYGRKGINGRALLQERNLQMRHHL